MDFPTLAQACAPDVHITTLAAVVRHESGFDPLAIGVNSKPRRSIRPRSYAEAVVHARKLIAAGVDFDVGYGQINVRNWTWLGVTPETIFDPCVNLAAAQRVLIECYRRATSTHGHGQTALYAAFSCYNTGNLTAGFKNGYVHKVLTGAGLSVPAVRVPAPAAPPRQAGGFADALRTSKPDAFAKPKVDAFSAPKPVAGGSSSAQATDTPAREPGVFGEPVSIGRP